MGRISTPPAIIRNSGGGSSVWGDITGTLSDQTDLQTALDAKLPLAGGTLTGDLTISTHNIITDTTTGTKIGTATTQKLGFLNATPVVQQANTVDLGIVLSNFGLRASGTAYPITTSGTVTLTGTVALSGATITNTGTLTLPTSTDTLVGRDTTDTLTNKTLTSPVINSPSGFLTGAAKITVGTSTPTSPTTGDIWIDTN